MNREPCVAGRFYPGSEEELKGALNELYSKITSRPKEAKVVIAPHAGYVYSGLVAASAFAAVKVPDNIILIGPNHTGAGKRAALMTEGSWTVPTGSVAVNSDLASRVMAKCSRFESDDTAHEAEHSLEVELPFILHHNRAANIVPITLMGADHKVCKEMGLAVAGALYEYGKETGKQVLIVVSSDMNHYESQEVTKKKDDLAINCVLNLDAEKLLQVVADENISMCGVVPVAVAIEAAKALGAGSARLISYSTSGETSRDFAQVVGYAGITIN